MPRSRLPRTTAPPGLSSREEKEIRDYFSQTYSGQFGNSAEQQALEAIFNSLYGSGDYYGGGVGGIDRQYSGGVMNEYGEFSGPGFNQDSPFGNQWFDEGSYEMSKHGGLAPSAFYTLDPRYEDYMNKTVRFEKEVTPYEMMMHPYNPEMWGDNPHGSREERENLAERGSFRFRDGNIAGTDALTWMMDRMNRRRTGRR